MEKYYFTDDLIELILNGKKTVTCAFASVLTAEKKEAFLNSVGKDVEVYNMKNQYVITIHIDEIVKFTIGNVPEQIAFCEGFQSVEDWQQDCVIFWNEIGKTGYPPETEVMIAQKFHLK